MDKYVTPYQLRMIFKQCRRLSELVKEPTTFIDIGPGKLNSEAWIIRQFWKNCQIIGFEPCKVRYEYLKKDYPGFLINEAISTSFSLEGYMGEDFIVNCRENEKHLYTPTQVGSTSLDNIISMLYTTENIVVWADVEGSELTILQGAKFSLEKGRIVALNLELNLKREAVGWCTANEVIDFLTEYGYMPVDMPKEFDHVDVIFIKRK